MSEIKLLPCPICNGKANIENVFGRNGVICEDCDLMYRGKFEESVEEVVRKWNTRKPMERIVERLEDEYDVTNWDRPWAITINRAKEIIKEEGGIE